MFFYIINLILSGKSKIYALQEQFKYKPTLHISTLLRASSISSLRESALAAMAWLLDFVAWYHLQSEKLLHT